MTGRVIQVLQPVGPGSFKGAMGKLKRNMSQKVLQQAFKATWLSIAADVERDYKAIPVPVKQGRYSPFHINIHRYRRKAGDLRRSVTYFLSKRTPPNGLPRAYLRVDSYPYNFLIHGTKRRKQSKTGRKTGRVPDRMHEQPFYQVKAPARINTALALLYRQSPIARPFD